MTSRQSPVAIGGELVTARAARVPWKVLVRRYGLCRARLYQLWRAALAPSTNMSIDISELEKPDRAA
jgi:hypothetical protein